MNAFEIATLEGAAAEALAYLRRAIAADRELTQQNLAVNRKTRRATRLSPELRQTIRGLIEGDNKMQILRMMKFKILAVAFAAALGAATSGPRLRTVPHSVGMASFPAAVAAPLAKAKSFARILCKSGTSFGNAKAGTSFGQM
jgi:hypothetical protein